MKIKPIAFTLSFNGRASHLITPVSIYDKQENIDYKYNAIWDTGSNISVISKQLAEKLNLKIVGEINVNTANGQIKAKKYVINIGLPNKLNIEKMTVSSGILGPGVDLLIGLDLITLGDFSITNVNNKTIFSFRFPSIKKIDYVLDEK